MQLPSPYLEVLDLACYKINPDSVHEMRKRLLLFYIHKHAINDFNIEKSLMAHADFAKKISKKAPRKRFSMKVPKKNSIEFDEVVSAFKKTKTETFKSILAEIKTDVLDNDLMLPDLRTLSAIV